MIAILRAGRRHRERRRAFRRRRLAGGGALRESRGAGLLCARLCAAAGGRPTRGAAAERSDRRRQSRLDVQRARRGDRSARARDRCGGRERGPPPTPTFWIAFLRQRSGEVIESSPALRRAVEQMERLGEATGDRTTRAMNQCIPGSWARAGHLREGEQLADAALATLEGNADPLSTAMPSDFVAMTYAPLGEFAAAERSLERSERLVLRPQLWRTSTRRQACSKPWTRGPPGPHPARPRAGATCGRPRPRGRPGAAPVGANGDAARAQIT